MTFTATSSFLERLVNSQLLDAEQIAACRAAAGGEEKPLADYLKKQGLLTRFQIRQLRAGATSLTVGKYVVVDLIGRGANGIVFKAQHRLMPSRFVALKTVDTRNLHHSDEALARFRREIDIVARLDHPNVVRALDVLQTRTHLYLVLEYVPGQDLARLVKDRGPLPVGEAVDYVAQAARGLHYAHGLGIVHRDLKPANLLLTTEGVVKLSDLGLARLFTQNCDNELFMKGLTLGTPEFMAPEQAEDAAQADPRSDLFSLGATLYHLLTAELHVSGSSYLHRLQRLLTLPPRPLKEARPDVPDGLADLADRLRARNPVDRPASAAEVVSLLQPFSAKPTQDDPRHWDPRRKAALVLEVLRGQATPESACSRHGVSGIDLQAWMQRFLEAGQRALDPDAPEGAASADELHAKIGAQAMEIQALRRRLANAR